MVAMAQGRDPAELLRAVVAGVAACDHVALVRLWLVRPGDLCAACPLRSECPDQTRCLHLVASAGNPRTPNASCSRVDGAFRRFPIGVRKIGRVAALGEELVLRDVAADDSWIVDAEWIRREGVRTFAGEPLRWRGEVLGVLGLFDREPLDDEALRWLRTFADFTAVTLANASAFGEIERLRQRLELENDYLREEVQEVLGVKGFVGGSPALRKVEQQVALVGPTEATVLISGESGTGKELVARAIHAASPRRERPLIKVNCGAIAESLFESEFFGHVKGSFTGALRDQPGRFELAERGTLFLDEVGELPMAMQAKLLRVLQEREYERVGDPRPRKADVRIVAATHRDLKQDVAAGRFRQDLFFRLAVFPLEIPPLRERSEDVGPLAAHFVAAAARRLGRAVPRLTRGAVESLERYDWPGNVRELQNVVERAVILAQGGPLRFELPEAAASRSPKGRLDQGARPERDEAREESSDQPLESREAWRRRERDAIVAALARSGGRVFGPRGAAQLLGMPPTTLASRLKALQIPKRPP
ncbi:MAG: sigma 54-interacting transcriptional regulator [Planctomycetes bacterium]|nr:sigma 54-interacting transcriptional regulator [Planctomycetota bacterium]